MLKRNITFSAFFKFTNLSIDRQSIDKHGSRFGLIRTKPLKKPWNLLSQKLKVSIKFSVWQPYVCLASYSLKKHSIWKQGRGSVTFEFGACSKGIVQAASRVFFLFPIFLTLKWECFNRVRALLSFSKAMTFHEFFRDLFTFSMNLSLAVAFKNVQNFPCFKVFFDLK